MTFDFLSVVEDKITGFKGTVTARCEYYTGCVLYEVIPSALKDCVPQKEQWLDEQRLVCTKAPPGIIEDQRGHRGGPRDGPSKRSMPFENEDGV